MELSSASCGVGGSDAGLRWTLCTELSNLGHAALETTTSGVSWKPPKPENPFLGGGGGRVGRVSKPVGGRWWKVEVEWLVGVLSKTLCGNIMYIV